MKLSRALVPAALAAALLVTGCASGGGSKDASGEACLEPGDASKSIETKGAIGDDLELTSKTPVSAKELQRSVLEEGDGKTMKSGQSIQVAMTMFDGADGEALQQQPASAVPLAKDQLNEWAYEAVRCAVPKQQVALVAPYEDVFTGIEPKDLGIDGLTKKDSIVIVMDFGKIEKTSDAASSGPGTLESDELLEKAEGTAKDAPEGFPTVKLAKDGSPTITMPEGVDAPSELEVATLVEGDGEKVEAGDRVYVNYRGVIWRTGEEFDSSWSRGAPADFTTDTVIEGFTKALVGQKVGSQVISIVPPASGYGENTEASLTGSNPDLDVTNDDTLVFVLDILGTVHADAK